MNQRIPALLVLFLLSTNVGHLVLAARPAAPAAAVGDGLLYSAGDLTIEAIAKADDATLVKQVLACTKGYKVDKLVRKTGEVVWSASNAKSDSLDTLSRSERIALVAVLGRRLYNTEVDVFVPSPDGGVPVTVYWDEPTVVTFESGPARKTLLDETMTAEKIQARYGVGEFTEKGGTWDGRALSAVDQALATLTKEELALIKGLPFRRGQKDPKHRALYHRGDTDNAITIYDTVLQLDRFAGSVTDPRAEAVHPIAHELGHAIADHPFRVAGIASKAAADEYKRRVGEVNAAADAFNARAKALGPKPDKKGQAELDALDATLTKAKADNDARAKEAERLVAAMLARDKTNANGRPTELAFGQVLEQKKSPTPYGRTKAAEHFAESFGIYKADPQALERISKAAVEWFRNGEHVKLASKPVE